MEKALKILGYENVVQLKRAKALKTLGLTEEDMFKAEPHFRSLAEDQVQSIQYAQKGYSKKLMSLFGATEEQILRRKATDFLGITEIDIEEDRAKRLSNIPSRTEQKSYISFKSRRLRKVSQNLKRKRKYLSIKSRKKLKC